MDTHETEVFPIRRYGASGHSRTRLDGRLQEARVLDDGDTGMRPQPVRWLVKNGVWLDVPEIIEYGASFVRD